MPYLKIQTNHSIESAARRTLLRKASQRVSEILGKPERYLMAAIETDVDMVFAADDAPCAFLELKSIGLSESQTPALSEALCNLMAAEAGVPRERVYVKFESASGPMWGWDGRTF